LRQIVDLTMSYDGGGPSESEAGLNYEPATSLSGDCDLDSEDEVVDDNEISSVESPTIPDYGDLSDEDTESNPSADTGASVTVVRKGCVHGSPAVQSPSTINSSGDLPTHISDEIKSVRTELKDLLNNTVPSPHPGVTQPIPSLSQ
jgi:hypothetical protein